MSATTAKAPSPHEVAELVRTVRRIDVATRRLVDGAMAGAYRSVFRGSGIEFDDVREYEEGDDPRSVDWAVTARTGRPFVKRYVDEREQTVLLVLDASRSMDGGLGAWSCREVAARVCAAVAVSAALSNDRVGIVAGSGALRRSVPPRRGNGQALRIVREALVARDGPAAAGSGPSIDYAIRGLRRRAIVFVVSDFLGEGWERPLGRCARRHDTVAVRVRGPELSGPFPRGVVRVTDPETGVVRAIDWSDPAIRDAYAERVRAWEESVAVAMRRAGADLVDVAVPLTPDASEVTAPLARFFRMRMERALRR